MPAAAATGRLHGGHERLVCGADDFSYYCREIPSVMLFTGSGTAGVTLHDARFLPADDTVGQVARVMLAGYLAAAARVLATASA